MDPETIVAPEEEAAKEGGEEVIPEAPEVSAPIKEDVSTGDEVVAEVL